MARFPETFEEALKGKCKKTREQELEEEREEFIQQWTRAGGTREQAEILLRVFAKIGHSHQKPVEWTIF